MKGFMHIVEILLVALTIFIVFTQFSTIPETGGDWPRTKLSIFADDVLSTLDKKGVNWFNSTELEDEMNRTLPANLLYSVKLENAIKPDIRVGCLCSEEEKETVSDVLEDGGFSINGNRVEFAVTRVETAGELFSLDFDVAIIYGYEDLSSDKYAMRNFLSNGRGVMELADHPGMDSVQRELFGINQSTAEAGTGDLKFTKESGESGGELNKLYKYFIHLPLFEDDFEDEELAKWDLDGNGESSGNGNPDHSIKVTGGYENGGVETRFYNGFESGYVDFDVYLEDGAALFLGFRDSGGRRYFASVSANESAGYSSFHISDPLSSVGTNQSVLAGSGEWVRCKVVARGSGMELYVGGRAAAAATAVPGGATNISLFRTGGDAYVDNIAVTYREDMSLESFLEEDENVTHSSDGSGRTLLDSMGTGVSACVINYNVEGKGRTAWIPESTEPEAEEYSVLLRSLVAWAAGQEHAIAGGGMRNPSSSFIYKSYGRDMFQNVKITLYLDYIY